MFKISFTSSVSLVTPQKKKLGGSEVEKRGGHANAIPCPINCRGNELFSQLATCNA